MKTSAAQARARDKWDAEHRDIKRKVTAKSQTKRFILKLANEDDLKEVQQWLAQRKENGGNKNV
jgi:hypothetical protein